MSKPVPSSWPVSARAAGLCAVAALVACASDPAVSNEPVLRVARPIGSAQCSGGGTPVAAMARELAERGVKVGATSCASDGRMYAAVCGGPDGRLGVLEIRAADAATAATLGFKPLDQWRGAAAVPCRD